MATKLHTVGLKEFRENTAKYIAELGKGKSFTVFRRSQPVFTISPADTWGDDGLWETVVDFTQIRSGGVPAREILDTLKKLA